MNIGAFHQVDKATFWRFVASLPLGNGERYADVRSDFVQQLAGRTLLHSQMATRFLVALNQQLDARLGIVNGSDRAVDSNDSIRYPNVSVEAAPGVPVSLSTGAPVPTVEVLSLSSQDRDLDEKPAEYLGFGSPQVYIGASHTGPRLPCLDPGPRRRVPRQARSVWYERRDRRAQTRHCHGCRRDLSKHRASFAG